MTNRSTSLVHAQAQKPNIVFMLLDNLGSGDIRVYGGELRALTPRVDTLAAEGMKLTSFHVESTCTPLVRH